MHLSKKNNLSGFTLIELLVVIGILTVLFAIALVAINPSRQFSQANNTQRRSDINTLLNAVNQYAAEHNGQLPTELQSPALATGSASTISESGANICSDLVTQYVAALPVDPTKDSFTACPTGYDTGYQVTRGVNNRITISAPLAENEESIEVTR